jgi:pimeloyl-ACP methyl ester carboxylesterase
MKAVIQKVSLEIEEWGAGDPSLVFLHYWGGTHRTWNKVAAELQSSYRIVTYDMRGWGESGAAENGYSIAALADEAAALIEHLGLSKICFDRPFYGREGSPARCIAKSAGARWLDPCGTSHAHTLSSA